MKSPFVFGSRKSAPPRHEAPQTLDNLVQAMGRAIRVDGGPTRDGMLKTDIQQLLRNLEVVARKSLNVPSPDLDDLRIRIVELNMYLVNLRHQEGI
jgi:hypothetical protein